MSVAVLCFLMGFILGGVALGSLIYYGIVGVVENEEQKNGG